MIKKDPTYRVTVYKQDKTIIVEYPLTCHFNVTRGVLSDAVKCTIQLYNLAPSTRNEIFQDAWTNFLGWQDMKYVYLEAGWNGSMAMIFKGRIMQAYSYKSGGQTDVITEIQAQALDAFDCPTSHTFLAGTSFKDIHNTIANDMKNVIVGNIGNLEGEVKTPTTFEGNALDELNKLTNGHTFVDNGVLNTIMDNEVIDVPVPVITDKNVLLETPRRRDANLEVKMLFEPDLAIGQLLEIHSEIFPDFNGQYKVVSFTHDCLISASQAGQRVTTVNLWVGPFLPGANVAVTGGASEVQFNKVKREEVTTVNSKEPSAVLDVYRFIQKNGYAPKTKITNNIYWSEVIKANSLQYEKPSIAVLSNLYSTSQRIQTFINKYYPGSKLQINSGWRSRGYNSTLRNADPNSEHIYGNAIDFMIPGQSTQLVYKKFVTYWKGRKYLHSGGNFIHADITTSRGVYANDW